MEIKDVLYLPSGRIFIQETDGYIIESTEMRDVAVDGKLHKEVRETRDPHKIWKHLVPYEKKWLLTVSTQKGCTYNCRFCDVANLNFLGNLTASQINKQIENILVNTPHVKTSKKVKIGYARMGEPACNLDAVLSSMGTLPEISESMGKDFKWLPCFNSILPRKFPCIGDVIDTKENKFDGFLHFQISCNSTDEEKRKYLFNGADVMPIDEVIKEVNKYTVTDRTVTLNFIVMEGVEVSIDKLKKMGLNSDKFCVKLIPLNKTENSSAHDLETYANYSNYEKLLQLKSDFEKEGIPIVVDAIAKCEEAGLCCGQLARIYL